MSLWCHRLDQNTTEKFDKFCPRMGRAEFVKFFGGILVQTMKAKEHFEINWPLEGRAFPSSMLYNWAMESSNQIEQDLDFKWMYAFSAKILKWKYDFRDFLYRYWLLQKIKNVLTCYEYIFDFLKKWVPIPEMSENWVSVSGFSGKMHRLIWNLDFAVFS